MREKIYKTAVIGCGNIGIGSGTTINPGTHAGIYRLHRKTELIALVERDTKRVNLARRLFPRVPCYSSITEMMKKEKPDIVSVATPPQAHSKNVLEVIKYKPRGVICEKPMATTVSEAQAMIHRARQKRVPLFINHTRHFDALLTKWAMRVHEGLLGEIYQGNTYYYNGLMNSGTHLIDLLRMYLSDPIAVRGWYNKKTSSKPGDPNVDGIIFFKNGALVTMQSLSKNYGHFVFTFIGEKGLLNIQNLCYEIHFRKKVSHKTFKGFYALTNKSIHEGSERNFFKGMVDHVVAVLDKKEKPRSTGEDGLWSLKVLDAFRRSADGKGKVVHMR